MLTSFNHLNIHNIQSVFCIMAVLNLPREISFLPENVILIGIIQGPHEPSKNINSFLRPLVDDLHDLWNGVVLDSYNQVVLVGGV